jgi:serine/threonine protein kinase
VESLGFIHRDVKPENILYSPTTNSSCYIFKLVSQASGPDEYLHRFMEMARTDPKMRASAAQMMAKMNLFAEEPRPILSSHKGNPRDIPPMQTDTCGLADIKQVTWKQY